RKVQRCRITCLRKSLRVWMLETHRRDPYVSANYSPDRIGPSLSISSCTEKNRRRLALCAQPGSMVSTASRITSHQTWILRSSLQRIYRLCALMPAREGGTDCVCLAPARAHSNTTSEAKTK